MSNSFDDGLDQRSYVLTAKTRNACDALTGNDCTLTAELLRLTLCGLPWARACATLKLAELAPRLRSVMSSDLEYGLRNSATPKLSAPPNLPPEVRAMTWVAVEPAACTNPAPPMLVP